MRLSKCYLLLLAALHASILAGCNPEPFPFEETDPDANGMWGVMTRQPEGAVVAGSFVGLELHGPQQWRHGYNGVPDFKVFPPTTVTEVSTDNADVLAFEAIQTWRGPDRRRAEWVRANELEEALAADAQPTNRIILRTGEPGVATISVSALVEHEDVTHQVEDTFEITVAPLSSITLRAFEASNRNAILLTGSEFEVEYQGDRQGFGPESSLLGFGYFDATVEPEGALDFAPRSMADLYAGDQFAYSLHRAPRVIMVGNQPGQVVIHPRPAGEEMSFEFADPAAVSGLSLDGRGEDESLELSSPFGNVFRIRADIGGRPVYNRHELLLTYRVEVLAIEDGADACGLTHGGVEQEPQSEIFVDDPSRTAEFRVIPEESGRCEIRITHIMPDASAGVSIQVPTEAM